MAYSAPYSYPYPGQFNNVKDGEDYCKRLYAALQDRDARQDYVRDRSTDADLKALIVRPEWYGAKGNGVNDDSTAIQAAITSLGTNGGIIAFSVGTYLVKSTILVSGKAGVCLFGAGKNEKATTIKWGGAANGTILELNNSNSITIGRLFIDGDDIAGKGIYIHGATSQAQFITIEEFYIVGITGTPGYAIQNGSGDGAEYGACQNLFREGWVTGNTYGYYQGANTQAVNNQIYKVHFGDIDSYGVCIDGGSIGVRDSSMIDCHTADFYIANAAYWVVIDNVEIEESYGIPLVTEVGSRSWPTSITNCRWKQGTVDADIVRFYHNGPLSIIHTRFEGIGGGTNAVVLDGDSGAPDVLWLNNQVILNAYISALNAEMIEVSSTPTFGQTTVSTTIADGDASLILKTNNAAYSNSTIQWQDQDGNNEAAIGSYYHVADAGGIEFLNATITNMFLSSGGNLGLGQTTFGTNSARVFSIHNGTIPASSTEDAFQMYSDNVAVGNAAPHFRTEAGEVVKLYKQVLAADLKETYATPELDTEAEVIAALNATNAKINDLITALQNTGLLSAT